MPTNAVIFMHEYRNAKLDKMYSKLPKLNCKGKCVQSCSVIKLGKYERERIAAFLGYDPFLADDKILDHLMQNPIDKWSCALLKDGLCSIYDKRPLICRLFGLVPEMKCPFGCVPERWVKPEEARKMLEKAGYFMAENKE